MVLKLEVLGLGISVILLNLGMYIAAPATSWNQNLVVILNLENNPTDVRRNSIINLNFLELTLFVI